VGCDRRRDIRNLDGVALVTSHRIEIECEEYESTVRLYRALGLLLADSQFTLSMETRRPVDAPRGWERVADTGTENDYRLAERPVLGHDLVDRVQCCEGDNKALWSEVRWLKKWRDEHAERIEEMAEALARSERAFSNHEERLGITQGRTDVLGKRCTDFGTRLSRIEGLYAIWDSLRMAYPQDYPIRYREHSGQDPGMMPDPALGN
jgi:hypothetical protein